MKNTHDILCALVRELECKPGWEFDIRLDQETGASCLVISVSGYNSAFPTERRPITVSHWKPIPITTYGVGAWKRWLFTQCQEVETHELGEWFRFRDDRPFLPLHGPGENPYVVVEYRDPIDSLTTQNGTVREPYRSKIECTCYEDVAECPIHGDNPIWFSRK